MPRSLGGTAQLRVSDPSSLVNVTHLPSHGDPSVHLVSIFSPPIWNTVADNTALSSQQQPPRPRPSLQVYYTASDAEDPTRLELAARSLETQVLSERHQGRDPAECDRLDIYGLAGASLTSCLAHQTREIAARASDGTGNKDWYIQRFDIGGGTWRRAIIIVTKALEGWTKADGSRQEVGLSVVFFDAVNQEDGESGFWERKAGSVEEEEVLVRELEAELNWQHSASQFED